MGPKKRLKGGSKGCARVGHTLIKDRNKSSRRTHETGWRHTSELDDGSDWGRLNLHSVTEESQLDEFLSIAQLAGTEFTAERLNMKVVGGASSQYTGLPTVEEQEASRRAQEENKHCLSIPRRPPWDASTTPEELELRERESFLSWRRSLVHLQEDERLTMTPFERNLEFWRQLWRVVERSDVVVQILEARDPLLFRCEDLEKYVREISSSKVNVLLLNKADLLSRQQRCEWLKYFREDKSIVVAFWSAKLEMDRLDSETKGCGTVRENDDDEDSEEDHGETVTPTLQVDRDCTSVEENKGCGSDSMMGVSATPVRAESESADSAITGDTAEGIMDEEEESMDEGMADDGAKDEEGAQDKMERGVAAGGAYDEAAVLSGEQVLELLLRVSPVGEDSLTTVGMVGYPNVGKSSTINALIRGKKVPVSATPGRTKHFQTLYLSERVLLCDCPGLVFPSFVSSKAEMICSGILPIDQMRDHTPPVSLVCQRIPRTVLERTYGIAIPPPAEGEEPDRAPYASELLSAYGKVRGYMTSHGQPDEARSSRYILKDYVSGKLLYCHPPPGVEGPTFNHQYHRQTECQSGLSEESSVADERVEPSEKLSQRSSTRSEFDDSYFKMSQVQAVVKGGNANPSTRAAVPTAEGKPWKKHNNKHKKEKTRRTYSSN